LWIFVFVCDISSLLSRQYKTINNKQQESTTNNYQQRKHNNQTGGCILYFIQVSFATASLFVLSVVFDAFCFCALSVTTMNNNQQQ
jgi:uncharacterized membrane protein